MFVFLDCCVAYAYIFDIDSRQIVTSLRQCQCLAIIGSEDPVPAVTQLHSQNKLSTEIGR